MALLFYFTMNSYPLKNRIVLATFKPIRGVFLILCSYIPGSSRHSAFLVLSTFKYDLNPVTLLSHLLTDLVGFKNSFFYSFIKRSFQSILIDCSYCSSRNLEGNPTIFLLKEKPFFLEIRVKSALSPPFRMGYIVSHHFLLSGYLTNSRHRNIVLSKFSKQVANFGKIMNLSNFFKNIFHLH